MLPVKDFDKKTGLPGAIREPSGSGLFDSRGTFWTVERHGAEVSFSELSEDFPDVERLLGA